MKTQITLLFVVMACMPVMEAQIDPSIPLRVNPVNSPNLLDQAIKIRQLQLQEQEMQAMEMQAKAQAQVAAEQQQHKKPPSEPSTKSTPDSGQNFSETYQTAAGDFNGKYWLLLSPMERIEFLVGIYQGYFYAKPSNETIVKEKREACLRDLPKNAPPASTADCIVNSALEESEDYKDWKRLDPLPPGSFLNTAKMIDQFFAQPENLPMAILAASMIARLKQEGRPQSEVDALMDAYREMYIRAPLRACHSGYWISAERCEALGTVLSAPRKVPDGKATPKP